MKKISKWNLYFEKTYGFDHREKVVDDVVHYLYDFHGEPKVVEISGGVMLGGFVSGHSGFKDGQLIFTSEVKRIERVMILNNEFHIDLYKATTKSGSEYYFEGKDVDPYGFLLMGDKLHLGWLVRKPGRYMSKELYAQHPELI